MMNAVTDEAVLHDKEIILHDDEEYEYIPHDEVAEGTRIIIEKHFEALRALANA